MRKLLTYTIGALLAMSLPVLADLVVLDGTGASKTVFGFVCFTTKLCNATVITNSAGTEIATPANPVRTDPTGTTTQPISGTVAATQSGAWNVTNAGTFATQSAQSGTWTVQPGNTANTTAWLVTGTGGTFPATQSGAWTVNPTTAANWGLLAQASTTSGQVGNLMMGAVTTSAPTYTTAQTSPLSIDTTGALRVNVTAGGGSGGTSSTFNSAFPSTGTAAGMSNGTNMIPLIGDATNGMKVQVTTAVGASSGSTTSGQTGSAIMGAVTTSPPSYTNATTNWASLDTAGNLRVDDTASSPTGSAVPASASYTGAVSGGNLVGMIQADASAPITVSTATTTQIVALTSSQKIYVTSYDVIAAGTGNITFVYGTGTNCATGQTALTGAYNLTAQAGIAKGGGLGPVLVVPASNALCVLTSAAVQMSGSVSYTKF